MTCMKYGILECVDNFGRYRQCKPVWVIVKMLFFYNSIPGRLFTIAGKFPEALAKLCEMELYERFKARKPFECSYKFHEADFRNSRHSSN